MTKTVIIDSHQTVVVQESQPRTVVTGIMGPRGASSFGELSDIDLSQLSTGAVLVYNQQTQKWTATTLLEQQTVDSGQF
jgi:hypothetical protein